MISWVNFYKYCFGLAVSESVLQEYDQFIAGRENVPFQLFIVLFYLLFITADLFIAIQEYDHSVKVHRHAMWIRLGMFSSIAAALWMSCVAVAMVLKRYKSKSKLFQRMSPYYRSVVECGIIVTAINVCLTMITKVHVGSCETNRQAYCNSSYQCGMLPQPLLLAVWFLSAGVQIGFRGVRLTTILINLFLSTATYIFCFVVIGPVTINTIKVIFLYSLFGFILIFEFQRSSMAEFMLNRQFNDMLIENKRLDQESRTSEMRIMVFNLAHNFKKPLSSFFGLIEIMHYNIQQCTWKYSRSSYSSSQSISTEVLEHMSKAWKCVEEIQCYNAHMVMNLNLIIDYMKASRAVPLIPSLQPIELTKTLSVPIQTMMHPIHNSRGVKIVLEYVDPSIADFIITDRCWIQEAILSFISNALRPSCGGPIKLFVTLKSSMSYKLDHHRYRRQHRTSSSRHTHRRQQQQQQQPKHRNQVVPFDSDDIKSDEDHRPLSGSELDDDNDDNDDDDEGYAMVDGSLAKSEICIKKSTVMQNRSFLLFEIQDCCDGITDEVKDKLFQPFYDTDNNMGLGLYCVGKRIEALGGQYGVSERNDNQGGSVFWFLIPYIVNSPNHVILDPTGGPGRDSNSTPFCFSKDHVLVSNILVRPPLKLLLVYGRCSSLELMEQTLSFLGHDCHHKCSGTDGFIDTIEQATSGSPYDAVLLDLDCIESDHRIGYITALRQRETEDRDLLIRRTQLVIGACAHTDYTNISNALTAGINTVLSVPFPVDSLYEIVDAFQRASRT